MIQAKSGDTVKVHYTGKFEDGTEFASSINDDPLQFTIGKGEVIPGLEQAVIGMSPGESKTAEILAEQAYGPYQESKVREINRDQFPPHLNLQVGKVLTTRKADGEKVKHIVTTVSETNVTIDANHPLAGEDLIFDIQLIEVV
ncbi:MAG: peptidylprolyl isomerase [Anaerolineae bacterium]|nr:peptidylprolyl isomerase [Anaerolineae bacterium]